MPLRKKSKRTEKQQTSDLHVRVNGNDVPVYVSSSGEFRDKGDRFSSNTLRGLEKKMRAAATGNGVPFENSAGRRGVITSKSGGKYSTTYTVRWEDNTPGTIGLYDITRPLTGDERTERARLIAVRDQASSTLDETEAKLEEFEEAISIYDQLKRTFGR